MFKDPIAESRVVARHAGRPVHQDTSDLGRRCSGMGLAVRGGLMAGGAGTCKALAAQGGKDDFMIIDTLNLDAGQPASPETEAERQARIAWQAAGIAKARASAAAGRVVPSEEVDA